MAIRPPREAPISVARSTPTASSTAIRSCRSANSSSSPGDSPYPRVSYRTTKWSAARSSNCGSHMARVATPACTKSRAGCDGSPRGVVGEPCSRDLEDRHAPTVARASYAVAMGGVLIGFAIIAAVIGVGLPHRPDRAARRGLQHGAVEAGVLRAHAGAAVHRAGRGGRRTAVLRAAADLGDRGRLPSSRCSPSSRSPCGGGRFPRRRSERSAPATSTRTTSGCRSRSTCWVMRPSPCRSSSCRWSSSRRSR